MAAEDEDSTTGTIRLQRDGDVLRPVAEAAPRPKSGVAHLLNRSAMFANEETHVDRYQVLDELGRGGMGCVNRSVDAKIGREVAMKTLLPSSPSEEAEESARFLREARVQALLEHPAIVPVYEIDHGPGGLPFFTMKRVEGETLATIVERLRTNARKEERGLHRLLSAFVTVCLAVDFAHERGVIHRDLKPENIMLGKHGEVYVLDWGIARVDGGTGHDDLGFDLAETRPGEIIGTVGFMAPEQALGDPTAVDSRSDIFALGAILYEILTQRHLIEGNNTGSILQATVDPERPPPSPEDSPPELYALVLRATRYDKDARCQTARELAEAVERFLSGDRDRELRGRLANERANEARTLANIALYGPLLERDAARARAMREAGRALAFVPEHSIAASVVLRLLAQPPEAIPSEVTREREHLDRAHLITSMRDNAVRTGIWLLVFPLLILMGPRHLWLVSGIGALALMTFGTALLLWKKKITSTSSRLAFYALAMTMTACLSTVFGPLVFVPGFAAVNTVIFAAQAGPQHREVVIGMGIATVCIPIFLELAGVVPPSMVFTAEGLTLLPRLTDFKSAIAIPSLLLVSILNIILPTMLATRLRDSLLGTEDRLLVQKWQLGNFVPETAREDT